MIRYDRTHVSEKAFIVISIQMVFLTMFTQDVIFPFLKLFIELFPGRNSIK